VGIFGGAVFVATVVGLFGSGVVVFGCFCVYCCIVDC